MANFTPNVNLEKPLGSERYLIPKFNANMDKIDTKFGELQNLGGIISGASSKDTPVDADTLALSDSEATGALKKLSWLNIKATLKTYFDSIYASITHLHDDRYYTESEVNFTFAPKANPTFTGLITTGGQIKFPATQVPSSDPNTLDDYEEGTFTSVAIGTNASGIGTYTYQTGNYIKIGNLVYFSIFLGWSEHTGTGVLKLGNLPFVSDTNFAVVSFMVEGLTYSGQLAGFITRNSSLISLYNQSPNTSATDIGMDTNVTAIWASGTYQTT